WAVAIGGGSNHRLGLYDMVMLKDNHIDYSGGITKAIGSTREYLKQKDRQVKIEIEVRNLEELQKVLETGGVDVVMLDNMDPQTMTQAVQMVNGKLQTEASGGIDENNILEVAKTGVDFISVGALTHSYKSIDLSLRVTKTH
ncbi:MAG: nicotinate-nucleotide diphosphorylase (carboxylating), partial [Bacteroidetes bacterium]|nr:nicotinate-nucleotide diphosphorylase (carboxylating) [Bacteroidota bacterium]